MIKYLNFLKYTRKCERKIKIIWPTFMSGAQSKFAFEMLLEVTKIITQDHRIVTVMKWSLK